MNNCLNCGCIEEHADKCILYTGPDIEAVGIEHGQRYDVLTVQLATTLAEHIERTVELKCLYTGTCNTCSEEEQIPEAVQIIIDKLCSLTAADIAYSGQIFCLGNDSISVDAINLLGRGYQYFVEPASTGTSFGYDLTGALTNMPAGYAISKVKATISGKKKGGKTVIADSTQPTAAIRVDNDRFPLTAEFQVRVNSPNGTVDMVHTLVVPSAESQSAGQTFAVKDYAQSASAVTQDIFNALVAAQSCDNKTAIEQLRNLQLLGCENIQYPNTDIKAIVAVHSAELCDAIERLDDLETVSYRECSDECEDNIVEIPLHDAIKRQGDIICDLQTEVKELRDLITTLQGQIQACCDANLAALQSAGSTTYSASGGSSSGGGCSGGNC